MSGIEVGLVVFAVMLALMVPGFVLLAAAGFYLCAHRLLTAARITAFERGDEP